jgi:hypothetical protein
VVEAVTILGTHGDDDPTDAARALQGPHGVIKHSPILDRKKHFVDPAPDAGA